MLSEHERYHGLGMGCSCHRMLLEHERYHGLGMDALVIVCSSNTNVIMVWAWMLWSSYALGTRTLLWFGHGCSGHRMLFEHERCYGLVMDALVIVCSGNTNVIMVWAWDALVIVCSWSTNVIMVWAWILWSSYALGTRTLLWFGHGCSGHRMLSEHERHYGLGMDALVIVCSRNTNVIVVWAWMLWSPYALGTRTTLWSGHGCSGHRMLSEHERYCGLGMGCSGHRMLSEHERYHGLGMGCSGHRMLIEHERYHGLGMDALVTICSGNTNVIMVWAWILWSSYALGTRTTLWFGHGCSRHRMLLQHERYHGLGMHTLVIVCSSNTNVIMVWAWDALVIVCSRNTNDIMVWAWMLWSSYALAARTLSWFGHAYSCHRMLSEHERYHGLCMDALLYALGARTLSWFGHGCSGHRMLWEHERYYGLGMDALVIVCSRFRV